ncbi:MAG: uncharacterized protein K0S58_2709 [Nitrospira sp.]|jgi:hypothetical protein|nr:uncharacterized protein [Nitrospira sp.]
MSEHDVEKLLGGFAADTLMPEERIRLYTAAMQDQQVVNALTDEQALKELLADPQVRDRLLRTLQQPAISPEGSHSWWAWFKRSADFAFAGGLAALLFAGAFGTKIYLERLDRDTQSNSTDNALAVHTPAPSTRGQPSADEPVLKAKESMDSLRTPAKKDALAARAAEQERLASPAALQTVQAAASAPVTGAAAPTLSARALFYGNQSIDAAAAPRPLGLRYSFVVRDTDGHEREVDAPTAAKSTGPLRISVEANQDAFLQILQSLGASGTRLWWPPQETGKISLKVLAGKRSDIPLPPSAENGLLNLIIRLSPKPFAPLTMQEVGMLDRFAANLLIEPVGHGGGTGAQEEAIYVVSQDSSQTAQMTVEIPVRR